MITKEQARAKALYKQHGTWKAAAEAIQIDVGNLHKIAAGKLVPSDEMLKKLGFERITVRVKR